MLSKLDDLITTGEELENFYAGSVQGLRDDTLSTQEFNDFQNHWLSANRTMFPDSSFDTTEVKLSVSYVSFMSFTPLFSLLMMFTKLY